MFILSLSLCVAEKRDTKTAFSRPGSLAETEEYQRILRDLIEYNQRIDNPKWFQDGRVARKECMVLRAYVYSVVCIIIALVALHFYLLTDSSPLVGTVVDKHKQFGAVEPKGIPTVESHQILLQRPQRESNRSQEVIPQQSWSFAQAIWSLVTRAFFVGYITLLASIALSVSAASMILGEANKEAMFVYLFESGLKGATWVGPRTLKATKRDAKAKTTNRPRWKSAERSAETKK